MNNDEPTTEQLLTQLRATYVDPEPRRPPSFIVLPDDVWRALFDLAAALRARLSPHPRLVGNRIDTGRRDR